MTTLDVDTDALGTIATALDTAAADLEDLASGVPAHVDAGLMTAVVASMVSQIVTSAGTVSDALTGTAAEVRTARSYYDRTDASASAGMEEIRGVMQP